MFGYRIYRDNDPEKTVMVEGASTHAWVDRTMRPMNMKKIHPELYSKIAALAE